MKLSGRSSIVFFHEGTSLQLILKPTMKREEDLGDISTEHNSDIKSPDLLWSLLQSRPLRTRTFTPSPPWWWCWSSIGDPCDQWLISDWSVIDQWLISADGIRSWAEVYDTGHFTVVSRIFGGGTTLVVTGKICFMVSLTLCFILCWGEYESNDISSWLFDQFELF